MDDVPFSITENGEVVSDAYQRSLELLAETRNLKFEEIGQLAESLFITFSMRDSIHAMAIMHQARNLYDKIGAYIRGENIPGRFVRPRPTEADKIILRKVREKAKITLRETVDYMRIHCPSTYKAVEEIYESLAPECTTPSPDTTNTDREDSQ